MSMADRVSRKGRFVFVAEAFAFLLLFLLPLKFGAIVGIPANSMAIISFLYIASPHF